NVLARPRCCWPLGLQGFTTRGCGSCDGKVVHANYHRCRRTHRGSKRLRDELGVQPGQVLELEVTDGRLEVEIAPVEMRLEHRRHGLVAVPTETLPMLTAEMVRDTLERIPR